jgi:hydrocephalus-inducing protein
MIICRGVGLEPQIIIGQMHGDIFEPTTSIVFNPILTHSQGDEQEIVIRNPCTFPIEIYNLEFDKQFLEEEKVNFSIIIIINHFSIVLDPSSSTRL